MVARYLETYGIAADQRAGVVASREDFGPRKPPISGGAGPFPRGETPHNGAGAGQGFAQVAPIRE